MLKKIENKIDGITMYRIMLYTLGGMVVWSFVISLIGWLNYGVAELATSLVVLLASTMLTHTVLAKLTGAPANIESSAITALILFLIVTPGYDLETVLMSSLIGIVAIASKYTVTYRLRHIFNPVAVALVAAGLIGYIGVEWWVASRYMLPVVAIAGLVVLLKTERWALVGAFIAISSIIAVIRFADFLSISDALLLHFISWPTIFFAAFMLTEPLGLPPAKRQQLLYAAVVAILATVPFSIGVVHGTPELALLAGNLLTLVVARPARYRLQLQEKRTVGPDTVEYLFNSSYPVEHWAGQYLEWTLPHAAVDSRGIRRYLTIVTPPGGGLVGFAVKHVANQSTWKQSLQNLQPGDGMLATSRAGDFVLALSRQTPLVFIAGGIGITPFMSMIRAGEGTGATLFFCNNTVAERCFTDELAAADVRTVYVTTNKTTEGDGGNTEHEEVGFIDEAMLERQVPDWREATYYISGPPGMVAAYEKLLRKNNIPRSRIVTDYFPGLA